MLDHTKHPYYGKLTPLCELAIKYGTDKGGWHLIAGDTAHVYTPYYHEIWKDRRQEVMNVLEIGINHGCSMRLWQDYFPNAHIYGIDSDPNTLRDYGPRVHCARAYQQDRDSLLAAMQEFRNPKFDFIVDDGSHEFNHQWISANVLMPFLKKDGLYVIEDMALDCQPEILAAKIPYPWYAINTGVGIGKAHCDPNCPKCHGEEGERLLVIHHAS